jgi:hypothetical protein
MISNNLSELIVKKLLKKQLFYDSNKQNPVSTTNTIRLAILKVTDNSSTVISPSTYIYTFTITKTEMLILSHLGKFFGNRMNIF